MSQLFSVHLRRKIEHHYFVGDVIDRVEAKEIDEIYHSLPLCTCEAYREKFGDQVVAIFPTPVDARDVRDTRRRNSDGPRQQFQQRERVEPRGKRAAAPKSTPIVDAGYADAINEHLRRTA